LLKIGLRRWAARSHTTIEPSTPTEHSIAPSGFSAIDLTVTVCPTSVFLARGGASRSHSPTSHDTATTLATKSAIAGHVTSASLTGRVFELHRSRWIALQSPHEVWEPSAEDGAPVVTGTIGVKPYRVHRMRRASSLFTSGRLRLSLSTTRQPDENLTSRGVVL
jgi:hypothetical protein